jgi:7-keto-8-aminopelargonate synthetase-like enzyme
VAEARLTLANDTDTPILMIHYDSIPAARAVVSGLRERGFFTCICTFPAVPINEPSIRFTISRHNSFDDIRALVDALAEVSTRVPSKSMVPGPLEGAAEAS